MQRTAVKTVNSTLAQSNMEMHVPGHHYSNYIILAGNPACGGLTCFCAFYMLRCSNVPRQGPFSFLTGGVLHDHFYMLAPPKTPYYTPAKPMLYMPLR